jgi:hypothetical protein
MIKIKGTIQFDPENKTKKHTNQSSWKSYAMISFHDDLCEYYQWFILKRYNLKLNSPIRKSHLSIINDIIPDTHLYEKIKKNYNGKEMSVYFNTDVRTDGTHWWLNATCPGAEIIRKSVELDKIPYFGYHITIGHAKHYHLNNSKIIHESIKKYGNEFC